jgi:hypothetical protein
MLDEMKMQRLAMIQYTYTLAVDQSHQPEPLNMVSLLLLHDAVELFLMLASEHLGAGKTGQEFMVYWDAINQKLPSKDFGQKDSMNRLNKARGNWKHYGIRLSTSEIDDLRTNVATFFQENTPKVFSIAFEEISMAMLVQEEEVRGRLLKAEKLSSTGEVKAALKEIAIAFQDLMYRFDWKVFEQNSVHLRGVSSRQPWLSVESKAPRELSQFARGLENELRTLHEQVKLLSLGINYRHYIHFQSLTPIVHLMASGTYEQAGDGHGQSRQDYLFCYHFVIECALRLQEIQFA